MKRVLFTALIVFVFINIVSCRNKSVITGTPVDYRAGDVTLKGFLAYDSSIKAKRPGVLVVHEWWGHNEYARRRAKMLASLGYTALAVDMYGDGKQAAHPKDAGKFASEIANNLDLGKKRFLAALELLKKHSTVNGSKLAAIGYCFGGGVVLHMARFGVDLKGVASFHGSLATAVPAKKGDIKAKILVLHGEDDKFIKKEHIDGFKKEMKEAGADYKFISYPGATHSFTNPEADIYAEKFKIPVAYNADADKKSWEEMKKFFKSLFI